MQAYSVQTRSGLPVVGRGGMQGSAFSTADAIEVVVPGRLPVVGGPWALQYAQAVATAAGPIGAIHIEADGFAELCLVEPAVRRDHARQAHHLTRRYSSSIQTNAASRWNLSSTHPSGNPSGGFFDLLTRMRGHVCGWLIRLADPYTVLASHVLSDIPRWTIVNGDDNSALAGAYCLIKRLAQRMGMGSSRDVGLMLMGVDRHACAVALWKLNLIVSPVLGRRVVLRGSQKRIHPPRVRAIARQALDETFWPTLREMLLQEDPNVDDRAPSPRCEEVSPQPSLFVA